MIKSVNKYQISEIFTKDTKAYFLVPKYQREYAWTLPQWKDLYDDITGEDAGYFIGSIICINNSDDGLGKIPFELIDGQQRLTTLSLFLAAIYSELNKYINDIDEDTKSELYVLRKSLTQPLSPNGLMIVPQSQNNNDSDYHTVMSNINLVDKEKKVLNFGNRKIAKCFRYFVSRIEQDLEKSNNKIQTLLEIKDKINFAVIVKIEVSSHAEAYTLFESLNNRGTPLTAIDLMKNLILSKCEKSQLKPETCFNMWKELLESLTDDYATQERFFRHYYNAFKKRLNDPFRTPDIKKKDPLGYIATKSNLLKIYEALINKDLRLFLEDVIDCGKIYSNLLLNNDEMPKDDMYNALLDLSRIQGAPSYLLLMYLFKNQQVLLLSDKQLIELIKFLSRFFVRRNLTDTPNTRDLTNIFMNIIDDIQINNLQPQLLINNIKQTLINLSASDEVFNESLGGKIYEENSGVARYALCKLAEFYMTDETFKDLWAQNDYNGKKVYVWTIEHIFPEGENIPQAWVDMIATGDKKLANQYREEFVHTLGNLTITGYNSSLSNKSFIEKRDRKNQDGTKFVGYRNGLQLNNDLKDEETWTIEKIQSRTEKIKKELINLFKLK